MSACALAMAALPATAEAATTLVPCNTTALVTAITNAAPSGDTLKLSGHCIYTLTSPLPVIDKSLAIDGNGSAITRSASAPAFRIFDVTNKLNLDRIALSGGNAAGDFGGAVAVQPGGTLNLDRSILTHNTAEFFGGISNAPGGTVNVSRSVIIRNQAMGDGGGAGNLGTMIFDRSVIEQNTAGGKGGGIVNLGGTVKLDRTVVTQNRATSAPGGIDNQSGTVTLTRSVVRNNVPTNCSPTTVPWCVN
ncbi:MAG: hypothetical protein ACRDSP_06630 [Pseudonocardiaceae bacterium]